MTSSGFLEENPEAAERVVNAFYEPRQAIEAGISPDEMAAIKETVSPDMDQVLWDPAPLRPAVGGDGSMPSITRSDAVIWALRTSRSRPGADGATVNLTGIQSGHRLGR